MKMATLEEEKERRTAIQLCVQTVMTSNDSFLNGMVNYEMGGRKPFMNVRNVSADEIACSV